MRHHTRLCTALAVAFGGLATAPAFAQESQQLERVVVTGSSIKRLESETALPVTVVTRDQIEKSGATNVEDILRRVTASSAMLSDSTQGAGYATSNANMRGLGANSTLVLLNGRRLAGHPFGSIGGSAAVDLNSIPFAAIDRIEVLRDGASAIYGTDAVGGVINFITRRDYNKGELTLRYGSPEGSYGGEEKGASVSFGMGDFVKDGYNILLTANFKDQERIKAIDQGLYLRHATEIPGSAPPTSFRGFPGAIFTGDFLVTPGLYANAGSQFAPCDPANTVIRNTGAAPSGQDARYCRAIYAAMLDNLPDSKKTDVYARGTFNLGGGHQLTAEGSIGRNATIGRVAPTPLDSGAAKVNPDGTYPPFALPVTSRYFPQALLTSMGFTAADWDPDGNGFAEIVTRSLDMGNRISDNTNEQYRFVVGANGTFGGWDYDMGLNLAQARGKLVYDGYLLQAPYLAALASGNINPFGPNDSTGLALLDAASLRGEVRRSKGTTFAYDAKLSRELSQMAGGPMAVALGIDLRKEKAEDRPTNPSYEAGLHVGGEGSVPTTTASRNIYAVFSELSMPFSKGIEATLAARYDRYSDFGGSFNPMARIRIQPSKELLLRASAGTGFRAPTLWDVNSPVANTNTADAQTDWDCPAGQANNPRCLTQFNVQLSSDPNLKPEKSRQFTVGMVFEPTRNFTVALDYWNIEKKDTIGVISGDTLMGDEALYRKYIDRVVRSPDGLLSYIRTPVENLGKLKTSGVDLDMRSNFNLDPTIKIGLNYNATYVLKYETQNGKDEPMVDYVGQSTGGIAPVPSWQHTFGIDWTSGALNVALEHVYTNGWTESAAQVDANVGVNEPYRVNDTSRWNLAVTYRGIKNWTLRVGARNLLDDEPPFTASSSYGSHAAGFAGSFADPRGRFLYGSVSYQFK
jgi:iron complex outermembrane receptor protein